MAFELVGRELAHYQLLRPLGSGAMSEVYLARDQRLDREVAVKVILDSVARKPTLVKRFEREARAAGRLDHPHVARVHYFGQTDVGAPFYAMELVDGWSLADIVEARVRLRIDQVLSLLAQCCAGLQAALDAGIVHRDIKPANLMVSREGVVKIVDFGLAKLSDDKSMTRTGTMLGTPYYMAPEVVRGDGGDWRSDIYSLGITFYQLIVGRPPYEADTPYGVMMKHINQPPPRLAAANDKLPPALTDLLDTMLRKEPEGRPRGFRVIQARAMALAGELPPRDLRARLAWCGHEKQNTLDQGGRCAGCGEPYGGNDRPARFHVDLVGWHKNGADEEVAAYIGKAVGNPPEVVAPLLTELPFRAAFRAPRERARKMQRTFYELGADVELVPADRQGGLDDAMHELPFRPFWPPEPKGLPPDTLGTRGGAERRVTAAQSLVAEGRSWTGLVIAGLALLSAGLVASLVLDRQRAPEPEARGEEIIEASVAPAPEVAEPAAPDASATPASGWDGRFYEAPSVPSPAPEPAAVIEAPSEATAEATPAPPPPARLTSRRFDILDPGPDMALAAGALATLEEEAAAIDERLGLDRTGVDLRFTDDALVGSDGSRRWPAAPWTPTLAFPLGGATSPSDASFGPAARLLYGRSALEHASGDRAPGWIVIAFSLVLEQGRVPPGAVADLAEAGSLPRIDQLDVSLGTNPVEAERTLHAWASWVVTDSGWTGVRRMLTSLARGGDVDAAFVQAWGRAPGELEAEWLATLGVE